MTAAAVHMTYAPVSMRPFGRDDWYGFCDAQRFDDGSEPLIGELAILGCRDATTAIALLDGAGLGVMAHNEDGEERGAVYFSGAYAARAVAMLRNGMSWQVLRGMAGAEVCS